MASDVAVLLMAIAAIAAAGLVLWSVLGDHGVWWMLGAIVLAAIQLIAATRATLADRATVHHP